MLKSNPSEPPPSAEASTDNEAKDSSNAIFEPQYINLDINVNDLNLYNMQIDSAFEKIVKWQKNLFDLARSPCGKEFIREMTTLINCWVTKSDGRNGEKVFPFNDAR